MDLSILTGILVKSNAFKTVKANSDTVIKRIDATRALSHV